LIRAATLSDAAAIARVHVDTWRAAYADILPKTYLDGLSYEEFGRFWLNLLSKPDTRCVFVAEDEGGVFGFVSGRPRKNFSKGPIDYDGVLDTIYVLPSHQGNGAGRRLVAAVARYFVEVDTGSMLLWVFTENQPARRFYESLGGVLVGADGFDLGGVWVNEVAYGWRNLGVLVEEV